MVKPVWIQKMCDAIASKYSDDIGKMLVHTGVIGWVLSSAAQVTAIVINDKLSKEQKMYMVPQELADAAVNIVSYYAISRTFKSVANKLVSTGKLLPETIRTFLKNSSVADKVGTLGFDVVKNGHLDSKMSTVYNKFYKGVDVIGTTLGSILSCNIVTPIIRNEIAANKQKKCIAKMDKKAPETHISNIRNNPESPSYLPKPTMQAFQTAYMARPTSGNLKI